MLDLYMLYEILYALAASGGREKELFGSCANSARAAFAGSLVSDAFPELWFEVPLLGEPRFDLHALASQEQLKPGQVFSPERTGGNPEAFEWFARQSYGVRQLALSWDLQPDKLTPPAVQLLVDDENPDIIAGFLRSVGRENDFPAYQAFFSSLPEAWFACYTGVFPGRPGSGLRVECIPDHRLQEAYAKDPDLLRAHLRQVGIRDFGNTLLPRCRALSDTPFEIEFQFDVGPDGKAGPVFSVSLRFACPPGSVNWKPFDPDREAGDLMKQIMEWGLADSRWRLLGETGFSERVSRKGESILLSCFTAFVKLRWRAGVPVDAKAYLMAFNQ